MTISCVAEQNATKMAHKAVVHGSTPGCVEPNAKIATISPICAATIQPRRLPNVRVRIGNGMRSTSGAQRNFSAYGVDTEAKSPIVVFVRPSSLSQNDSVEKVSASGSPLEKPSKRMTKM